MKRKHNVTKISADRDRLLWIKLLTLRITTAGAHTQNVDKDHKGKGQEIAAFYSHPPDRLVCPFRSSYINPSRSAHSRSDFVMKC